MSKDIRTIIDALPPMADGEQVHVHHCKEGRGNDRLYIKRTASGYIFNCFHCGESGGVLENSAPRIRPATRLSRGGSGGRPSRTALPADATSTWGEMHPKARAWLGQYLTSKEVEDNGILYSPSIHRVVLPVHRDGVLVGYQTRRLDDDEKLPKYLTYSSSPADYWLYLSAKPSVGAGVDVCVLVEDFLSAAKCSYHCASAALFGTNLKDGLLARVLRTHRKFLIFLDDDNHMVRASARKIKKRLDIFGECGIIEKGMDPKDMTHEELERVLV